MILTRILASRIARRTCKHDYVPVKSEYNNISMTYGGDKLYCRCRKCGKAEFVKVRK